VKGWRYKLLGGIERVESRFTRLKLSTKLRYGWLGPVRTVTYRGHGTPQAVYLTGRVVEEKIIRPSFIDDSAWRNLRAMASRFLSAEVPGARLLVRLGGTARIVVANEEGFFDARIEPREPLPKDQAWQEAQIELLWPYARGQDEDLATAEILVPPQTASFGVITDIDDTILRTEATSVLRMLRLVMLTNAHTRLPFEGVGSFYRALRSGADGRYENPVFYVSTGPWNIYDLLAHFLEIQKLPNGPIFLKDWGGLKDLLRGMDHLSHKLQVIRGIFEAHPDLSFVLVGDSGQQDAEVYGQVAREFPRRVRAIYIRDVKGEERAGAVNRISGTLRALGVPMLLVSDTVAAAEHAAANGLIPPEALPTIRERRKEDANTSIIKEGAAILEHLSHR